MIPLVWQTDDTVCTYDLFRFPRAFFLGLIRGFSQQLYRYTLCHCYIQSESWQKRTGGSSGRGVGGSTRSFVIFNVVEIKRVSTPSLYLTSSKLSELVLTSALLFVAEISEGSGDVSHGTSEERCSRRRSRSSSRCHYQGQLRVTTLNSCIVTAARQLARRRPSWFAADVS